jgi:hypothetical protein
MQTMDQDIVIVREGEAYRLLHGHLRLANVLRANGEAWIEVSEGHRVRIVQARGGYLVASGAQQLPLLRI